MYNLGTGKGNSILEVITTYSKVIGKPLPYDVMERRLGDIGMCVAKVDHVWQELKWKSQLGLEDMCRDSYNFIRKKFD